MKVLVSACLLGEAVRYDGRSKGLESARLESWWQQGIVISFCPEMAGGLPVPRAAAEIQPDGRILTRSGEDVSAAFIRGAQAALDICQQQDVEACLLKEFSPSCGSLSVYDGRFSGQLRAGEGVTARLLLQHGIRVFSERQLAEFMAFVESRLSR
jgi:uncharacterized protein YbbK (DUF523 family)